MLNVLKSHKMEKIDRTKLNRDFHIVFTAKTKDGEKRKRHFISANTIDRYIGIDNANNVFLAMEKMKLDKATLKFRKHGKLEIYCK